MKRLIIHFQFYSKKSPCKGSFLFFSANNRLKDVQLLPEKLYLLAILMSSQQIYGDIVIWEMMGIYVLLDFWLFCDRETEFVNDNKNLNHIILQNFLCINLRREPFRYTTGKWKHFLSLPFYSCWSYINVS